MGVRLNVINEHLRAQQDLSVVERFARLHDEGHVGTGPLYESQIPLSKPQAGQQYAFQVDLDACTGCKACVVGCNRLNGLDPDEAWRAVGVLHGGSHESPLQQTVTAACHHCLDPACMLGCPVGAYEKDSVTGIVKHLDDQCIGCQYCTLTCPYEVPKYNDRLGIVRKCDMCQDRLADGESPACVESCPNGAITIKIVEISQVRSNARGNEFLPHAPSPSITAPTTCYTTGRDVPKDVLAGNSHTLKPAHAHAPLAVMLVLTQLAIGTFVLDAGLSAVLSHADHAHLSRWYAPFALLVGAAGLVAATLHLGRPLYAFRALLGLRTSWMSREILAGGLFVKLAAGYVLCLLKPEWFVWLGVPQLLTTDMGTLTQGLRWATALSGLLAGACSAMIYIVTRKAFWGPFTTGAKFLGTGIVLGLSTVVAGLSTAQAFGGVEVSWGQTFSTASLLQLVTVCVIAVTLVKLGWEVAFFRHLSSPEPGELWRSAQLMQHHLRPLMLTRFALGASGGVLLPCHLLTRDDVGTASGIAVACASLAILASGELLERLLFFKAVSGTRMPGSIGK